MSKVTIARACRKIAWVFALAALSVVLLLETTGLSLAKSCTFCADVRRNTVYKLARLHSLNSTLSDDLKGVCHEPLTAFPSCSVYARERTASGSEFECSMRRAEDKSLNFFAVGTGIHTDFLPLYAFYALQSNSGAFVEMVVQDKASFILNHSFALKWLEEYFGLNSLCVRGLNPTTPKRTTFMNTWRYLEVPYVQANFTYIGDIDILLTESVLDPRRLKQMELFNLSYSNVRRQNEERLTGVMLLRSAEFYTKSFLDAQATVDAIGNDEVFLYRVIAAAGLGLPPIPNSTEPLSLYRPVHGLHISLNRGLGKAMCLTTWREEPAEFCRVFTIPVLEAFLCASGISQRVISEYLDSAFKQVNISAHLHCQHQDMCVCTAIG